MMKLYTSLTSPYGRIARIVRLEKGLADRIALHPVKTRGADNSYYAVNPSGRVPSLILNDGAVLEDSTLVCWFMDHLDGAPTLLPPEGMAGLEHRRIEATARSMFDGLSLWEREYLYREAEIRSATIIAHEQARALRLADVFEKAVQGKVLSGPPEHGANHTRLRPPRSHDRPPARIPLAGRPPQPACLGRAHGRLRLHRGDLAAAAKLAGYGLC